MSVHQVLAVSFFVWAALMLRDNFMQTTPIHEDKLAKDVPAPKLDRFLGPTLTFLVWYVDGQPSGLLSCEH